MTTAETLDTRTSTSLAGVDLVAGYGDRPVLDGIGIEVPAGRISVIIGANASGKSTLLGVLARLLKPSTGTVALDGSDIHGMPTRQLAKRLGLLPQTPIVPEGIVVADLVARGRHPHRRLLQSWAPGDDAAVARALELTETTALADRPVDELSGGQRQRVWIAMALAQETEVLLLDEPTTFLDLTHQVEVLDLLTDLNRARGTTIAMVLHDVNLAARYADHLFAVCKGRLVASGPPSEVLTSELVHEVLGLDSIVVEDPVSGSPLVVPRGRHHVR
jgi:iron complex transport system ATP-binding protein